MNKERGPERPTDSWMLVRRYPDVTRALGAYEAARDLLLEDQLDASVLRLTVNHVSFVTVLGEVPLGPQPAKRMEAALGEGVDDSLPEEVGNELRRRRRAFKHTGLDFIERRSGQS